MQIVLQAASSFSVGATSGEAPPPETAHARARAPSTQSTSRHSFAARVMIAALTFREPSTFSGTFFAFLLCHRGGIVPKVPVGKQYYICAVIASALNDLSEMRCLYPRFSLCFSVLCGQSGSSLQSSRLRPHSNCRNSAGIQHQRIRPARLAPIHRINRKQHDGVLSERHIQHCGCCAISPPPSTIRKQQIFRIRISQHDARTIRRWKIARALLWSAQESAAEIPTLPIPVLRTSAPDASDCKIRIVFVPRPVGRCFIPAPKRCADARRQRCSTKITPSSQYAEIFSSYPYAIGFTIHQLRSHHCATNFHFFAARPIHASAHIRPEQRELRRVVHPSKARRVFARSFAISQPSYPSPGPYRPSNRFFPTRFGVSSVSPRQRFPQAVGHPG